MEFYVSRGGQEFGPYSEGQVRELLVDGSLTSEDLAWHEGAQGWSPLTSFPEFVLDSTETIQFVLEADESISHPIEEPLKLVDANINGPTNGSEEFVVTEAKLSPKNNTNQAEKSAATAPPKPSEIKLEKNVTPSGKKADENGQRATGFLERINANAAALIAFFTIVLVCVSGWQGYLSKESLDESRTALKTTQRAFVYPTDPGLVPLPVGGLKVVFKWKNCGNTPTNGFGSYLNFQPQANALPPEFKYPDLDSQAKPITGRGSVEQFYVPSQSVVNGVTFDIPSDVVQQLQNNTIHYYIWGWAEYNDFFEGTPKHRIEFCYELLLGPTSPNGQIIFQMNPFGPHNSQYDIR